MYHYNIIDRERIELLGPLSQPIIEQFSGELIVANPAMLLEGSSPYSHIVVYKFNSTEDANNFYHSPESRELSKFRNEVTQGFVVIMPQYEERNQSKLNG
jgi:uncharacterized protein (DUF1330 family)